MLPVRHFATPSSIMTACPFLLGPSGIPAPRSESVIKAVLSGPFDAVDQADQFRRKVASVGNDFYGKFIQQIGTLHNA